MAGLNLTLSIDRAREINTAMCQASFAAMGLIEPPSAAPLMSCSLPDLLRAAEIVRAGNRAARGQAGRGDAYVIQTVPDERLIAAIFALLHYPGLRLAFRGLAIFAFPPEGGSPNSPRPTPPAPSSQEIPDVA